MRHKYKGILATLVLSLCLFDGCRPSYGAKVIIVNVGTVPMRSVVVRVTGKSYPLGELGVGQTLSVDTYPTGESSVTIEHTDAQGNRKTLPAGGYFEPGSQSTIKVKVTADFVVSFEQQH